MKDKLLLFLLLALSFAVGTLLSLTLPFIVLSALGTDAPDVTPYVAAVLATLVAAGHASVAIRIIRPKRVKIVSAAPHR
ncbi:transcriptional regulator [Microbacterium testaceum StLB037]|uniref:Transcriptional regulator n=1 Tax=Microbacterium testaceum (strain StLB037) TaxID=979556 RepID=E8N706_MICTS|nr:hypothetical protein [Microbacterium testaceum]BAJ74223.1 transcriptional regulator [Microbacterium testaceum StLB037]